MAFFGLTALGPQNTFATSAKQGRLLHIFEQQDFQTAWDKIIGKGVTQCRIERLGEIMESLFRGPVPLNDKVAIETAFEQQARFFEIPNILSHVQYMRLMSDLRVSSEQEEASWEGKLKPNCEFNSSRQFQGDLTRHHRMQRELPEKQVCPLTATQEYGWERQTLQPPVAGRSGTDITRFAAELVKNGIYY